MSSRKTHIFIIIISIFLSSYWVYSSIILTGDQPYYRDYDPEMNYLMNSLLPFKGQSYFYTDHPGTPIEIMGTVLLAPTYLFHSNRESFILFNLENPDLFLNLAHGLVTILSIGCAVYFFYIASKTLQNQLLVALSLAIMFYGLHPYSLTTLTIWSHTAFNFPFGCLYLLALYHTTERKGFLHQKTIILLGLALGFMIAIMINFLPWLVTTLIYITFFYRIQKLPWVQLLKALFIFLLSLTLSFLLSVAPSVSRIAYFFGFFKNLIEHQLPYGNGSKGITPLGLLLQNFSDMFK